MTVIHETNGDMSLFKNRLTFLMCRKGIRSALNLATILVKEGRVKVKHSPDKDYLDEERVKNEIGSVVKKIRKHLSQDTVDDVQGEFLRAYAEYFECSADFLMGFTPLISNDMSVRQISEKTGLSEGAVTCLIDEHDNGSYLSRDLWSLLIESDMSIEAGMLWIKYSRKRRELETLKAAIAAIEKTAKYNKSKDFADKEQEPMKTARLCFDSKVEEIDSIALKLSRSVLAAVDSNIESVLGKENWHKAEYKRLLPKIESVYKKELEIDKALEPFTDSGVESSFKWHDHSDKELF